MYNLLKSLSLPPLLPLALITCGLALAGVRRASRVGYRLAWGGTAVALVLSMPLVGRTLIGLVEVTPTTALPDWTGASAIVVLSAGADESGAEYGGATVDAATLVRVRYAARLYKATRLPLLVTGGAVPPATVPTAHTMKAALEGDFGVPVRWVEDRARSTADNARLSAAVLRPAGVETVVLVTEAYHMRRSMAVFRAAGLRPVAAPTATRAPYVPWSWQDVIPSMSGLSTSYLGMQEVLGLVWYRLNGAL